MNYTLAGMLIVSFVFSSTEPVRAQTDERRCEFDSLGLVPLDLLGTAMYTGSPEVAARLGVTYASSGFAAQGGFYPGGRNVMPESHRSMGLALTQADIVPRDLQGHRDKTNGRIVLMSLGMSNTAGKWRRFQELLDETGGLNPKLHLVNGARGGWDIGAFLNRKTEYFAFIEDTLAALNLSKEQVQVVWLEWANALSGAREPGGWPGEAERFQGQLRLVVAELLVEYPNLRQVFLSSRAYGGYATRMLNPEPYAYEYGFSIKWLIEEQIQGLLPLSEYPWLAWGPYIWADGAQPNSKGLNFLCADYTLDGVHPGRGGREKISLALLDFFQNSEFAAPWFKAQ